MAFDAFERESPQERLRLARLAPEGVDFMYAGGWSSADARRGGNGIVAHRGVLTSDEWRFLDRVGIVAEVEQRLGFTLAELRHVFRQGRKSAPQRERRAVVDARLLELKLAGGNLTLLARVTGVHPHTFQRAIARARMA